MNINERMNDPHKKETKKLERKLNKDHSSSAMAEKAGIAMQLVFILYSPGVSIRQTAWLHDREFDTSKLFFLGAKVNLRISSKTMHHWTAQVNGI